MTIFKIIFLHDEKIFFDKIFFRELEFVSTFDFCGFYGDSCTPGGAIVNKRFAVSIWPQFV